jgi:hypothetical protein
MTHAADCVCWPSAASLSGVDQSLRPDWIGTATLDRAGISDCGLETASTVEAHEQEFKMARCAGEILAVRIVALEVLILSPLEQTLLGGTS